MYGLCVFINECMYVLMGMHGLGSCVTIVFKYMPVADLRGGFRGFKPPPWAAKKKKKLMCIEKRHHNMSRPTQYVPIALCLRLSLRQ